LTSQILTTYKQQIHSLTLIPAGGGCFELSLNGELVYSKLKTDTFPDEGQMLSLIGERLSGARLTSASGSAEK
jgi:selenoprotein W-related protein